jgi:hypothetical protein
MRAASFAQWRAEGNELELARVSEALADLSRALSPVEVAAFVPLEDALSDWRTPRTTADLGPRFPVLLRAAHTELPGVRERDAFNRALVAQIASNLRLRLPELELPAAVLDLVPSALSRLHEFLSERHEGYDLGDDCFLKDVRLAAGWTVPCGAKVVDLRCHVSLPVRLLAALRGRAPQVALKALAPGKRAPWFEQHTDSRYLDEFGEAGIDNTYLRVASMLRRHPGVGGLTAYSWFYDPQLDEISPRLSYLYRRPLERGAVLLRGRTSDYDVKNATARSRTRKRLYEAGKYKPVGHRILWFRRDILRWADQAQWAGGGPRQIKLTATRS